MYIVIELQKASKTNAGAASIVNTYEEYNEAESRYYSILSYAALSQIFLHGAYLFSEDGHMLMNRQYIYEPPAPEPEPTPEPEPESESEFEPEPESEPESEPENEEPEEEE